MESFLTEVHQIVCLCHLNVAQCIVDVSLILNFSCGGQLSLTDACENGVNVDGEQVHGGPVFLFG